MSVALSTLRQKMAYRLGSIVEGTTTSTGTITTLVSTHLKARTLNDDTYKYWWALPTGSGYGADSYERLCSAFTQSNGTVTVDTAWGAAIDNAVTFELHRYQPSVLKKYLNQAMEQAHPFFAKPWDDRTLVTGNYLPNSHFEDWAQTTYPDYWATVGASCTATKQTGATYLYGGGTNSLKIVRIDSSGVAHAITQANCEALRDLEDSSVDFYAWALTSVASRARLSLVSTKADGTTSTLTSSYHTGGGLFELLSMKSQAILADAVSVTASLNIEGADTVYFDNAALFGKTPYEYVLPTGLIHVSNVYRGNDWKESDYHEQEKLFGWTTYDKAGIRYLRFSKPPLSGYKMRLQGYGYFTDLSADTDTWAIDPKQADIIIDGAIAMFLESVVLPSAGKDVAHFQGMADRRRQRYEQGLRRNSMTVSTLQTDLYGDTIIDDGA